MTPLLIDDVAFMHVFQNLGADCDVQVGLHELKHQVDVAGVFGAQNPQ